MPALQSLVSNTVMVSVTGRPTNLDLATCVVTGTVTISGLMVDGSSVKQIGVSWSGDCTDDFGDEGDTSGCANLSR